MFSRSRKKIILSIMISLILLLSVTLAVIMLASYREIRVRDSEMLESYSESYSPGQSSDSSAPDAAPPDQGPGGGPGQDHMPPGMGPDYRMSTFYSVAINDDGTVLEVSNDSRGLYTDDDLVSLSRNLAAGKKRSAKAGDLTYLVTDKDGYTLVAFIDNTVVSGNMRMLLRNVLITGGAAIIAMFFISGFLAKRIVQPLEENDRRQRQFISDASHELKTPVAVISANAELLSRELGSNDWLANIQYENERMGDLVKQLLDLSRAENSGTAEEDVDMSRTVTGEVLAFESLAFDQGKTIKSSVADDIHVSGSQTQLTQLVSVLLDNALQHSSSGEIEVSLSSRGHNAVLSVTNPGEAIPSDKLEHLFDRFYRLDEARTGDGHHYGLGLAIAKAVTEKHHGDIGVSCEDGKIFFTVTLPCKKQ